MGKEERVKLRRGQGHWTKTGLCGLEGTDAVDFLAVLAVGEFEIVMELEAEEESGGHTEEAGKPEIMDRRDSAIAVLHFRDVAGMRCREWISKKQVLRPLAEKF